jgi:hypothetical protein
VKNSNELFKLKKEGYSIFNELSMKILKKSAIEIIALKFKCKPGNVKLISEKTNLGDQHRGL